MRQANPKQARAGLGWMALALAVGAVAVSTAAPARANNDFQNGFEDQLGRLAAYQVAALGVRILGGAYVPVVVPVPAYYAAPVVYAPSYGSYYYGHPHRVRVHPVAYYSGRPCNGGYDAAPGYSRGGRHPHSWGNRGEHGGD